MILLGGDSKTCQKHLKEMFWRFVPLHHFKTTTSSIEHLQSSHSNQESSIKSLQSSIFNQVTPIEYLQSSHSNQVSSIKSLQSSHLNMASRQVKNTYRDIKRRLDQIIKKIGKLKLALREPTAIVYSTTKTNGLYIFWRSKDHARH